MHVKSSASRSENGAHALPLPGTVNGKKAGREEYSRRANPKVCDGICCVFVLHRQILRVYSLKSKACT